jgi:hypothetical protein
MRARLAWRYFREGERGMSTGWLASGPSLVAAGALALAVGQGEAQAAVADPTEDFLPVYTGPQTGDLDVTRVDARITVPGEVRLSGTHASPIGATPGAAYVWGIDRGQGTDQLNVPPLPVGAGVSFDAVAILLPDGTGSFIDLLAGTSPTAIDTSAISISGGTISVILTEALLTSTGFRFAEYGYNLWPRYAPGGVNPFDNTQISDFAPDASTFTATIPLPVALTLQLAGLAVLGSVAYRRRSAPLITG